MDPVSDDVNWREVSISDLGSVNNGTKLQHRRGTNAEILAGTPAIGELWFNTTDNAIHMGDGVTQGGVKHLNENIAEIVYKQSVSASAVDNMITGSPSATKVGGMCSTGNTKWKRISDSAGDITDFFAISSVWVEEFGLVYGESATEGEATNNRNKLELAASTGKNIHFPKNEIITITLGGLNNREGFKPRDYTSVFGYTTNLRLFPSDDYENYQICDLIEANHVTIRDLYVEGDVVSGGTWTGEFGHGFGIFSSNNIRLVDCGAKLCNGDGAYIGISNSNLATNVNVTLDNFNADDNRRQGLSITSGVGVRVWGGAYTNTGRTEFTLPGAGIDIEPNPNQFGDLEVKIDGVRTSGNINHGLLLALLSMGNSPLLPTRSFTQCDIQISNYSSYRDMIAGESAQYAPAIRVVGISESSETSHGKVRGSIQFTNTAISSPAGIPFRFSRCGFLPPITFANTSIVNVQEGVALGSTTPSGTALVLFDTDAAQEADVNYEHTPVTFNDFKFVSTRGETYSSTITDVNHRVTRPFIYNVLNSAFLDEIPEGIVTFNDFYTNINYQDNVFSSNARPPVVLKKLIERDLNSDVTLSSFPHGIKFNCVKTGSAQTINLPPATLATKGKVITFSRKDSSQRLVFQVTGGSVIGNNNVLNDTRYERGIYSAISSTPVVSVNPVGEYKFESLGNGDWILI